MSLSSTLFLFLDFQMEHRESLPDPGGGDAPLGWQVPFTAGATTTKDTQECEVCGGFFGTPQELERHLRSHTGKMPFHCPACGAGFNSKRNMLKHWRKHDK